MATTASRKLTLDDIVDQRAYERERDTFRRHVIALKQRRRVSLGPFVTLLFENRDTVRFQVQEMARVEKIITDRGIQAELDIYNALIPDPGKLAATLFIELTSEDDLKLWLPQLVGIERAVEFRLAGGSTVASVPESAHEAQLTREAITSSVHYLHFAFPAAAIEALEGGATLATTHPAYSHETELRPETVQELLADLR